MADEETEVEETKPAPAETKEEETKVEEKPVETKVDETEQLRTRAAQAEARAADAERRAQELAKQTMTPADYKKWFDDNYVTDPFMATNRVAEDRAWQVHRMTEGKNMVIENYIDSNPRFKDKEREIKRKLANFFPPTEAELVSRIELECLAAVGKDADKKIAEAHKQGQEDAEKKKKVLGSGTAVGTTVSKTGSNVILNAEETMMVGKMGLSVDKVKEAQLKGNVVE